MADRSFRSTETPATWGLPAQRPFVTSTTTTSAVAARPSARLNFLRSILNYVHHVQQGCIWGVRDIIHFDFVSRVGHRAVYTLLGRDTVYSQIAESACQIQRRGVGASTSDYDRPSVPKIRQILSGGV